MTARDWYVTRFAEWTSRREAAAARSVTVSRLRLAAFFAAVALIWWGARAGSAALITVGAFFGIAFVCLVAMHGRLFTAIEHAEASRRVAERGLARIDRNWTALDEIPEPRDVDLDAHAYARDLDLFGHASLTKWLGPAATRLGHRTLLAWLLDERPVKDVEAQQEAIAELAIRPDWREAFAAEGERGRGQAADLTRFMTWAESSAVSAPSLLPVLVIGLTTAIWLLLALQTFGVFEDSWWMLPLAIGLVLSFAFAKRMYSVFDRASIGQRGLARYASMLTLAYTERWSAADLIHRQSELRAGGNAPRAVKRLSRLVEWSELRRAAAILHFPIQAFTLWDFHVFFAIERWRHAHGRRIGPWLSALGEIDALSVLAAIGHDSPEWARPRVDSSTTTITAASLAHPLIPDDRRVANDVEIGPPGKILLVTGSNMSGKSTLLRAVGVNVVLARAGAPVCAAAFTMPPSDLQTSIRVQDSLELGMSYFMAALARLKAVVDAAERDRASGRVLLYLLDEVLQGTNSAERAIAVRAVARHLLDADAIGAMTTHDLALAQEEPFVSHARLVHFAEQVHEDGRMTFDYRLRPGLATSRNALRLMQLIGIAPK